MNYLLDTCIISELIRKSPTQNVVKWLKRTPCECQYLSAISVGEIYKGIARLESGDQGELCFRIGWSPFAVNLHPAYFRLTRKHQCLGASWWEMRFALDTPSHLWMLKLPPRPFGMA